jgi:hypothetical protein
VVEQGQGGDLSGAALQRLQIVHVSEAVLEDCGDAGAHAQVSANAVRQRRIWWSVGEEIAIYLIYAGGRT